MDLDGTLTDVSERYYGIFSHYIQNYGFHIMSDAYMDLRRSGFSDGAGFVPALCDRRLGGGL